MNEYWNFVNGNIVEYSTEELLEIIKKCNIGDSIFLTVEQLKKLENKLNFILKEKLKHCVIFLYMNSPTELSYDEYKYFHNKYKFYHLFVSGFSKEKGIHGDDYNKTTNIDPDIMLIYLKKINELTKDLPKYSDTNIEDDIRTICILSNRIVQKVFFDIKFSISKQTEKYKSKFNVPNEIIGIIDERAVCRGFAGIFRDACNILGYESINIHGFDKNQNGHEWNQVRIGNNWFNCDITWDSYDIKNKNIPMFLLSNDKEFYNIYYSVENYQFSHSFYLNDCNKNGNEVVTSIPREKIISYLYQEEKNKKTWLNGLLEKRSCDLKENNINNGGRKI